MPHFSYVPIHSQTIRLIGFSFDYVNLLDRSVTPITGLEGKGAGARVVSKERLLAPVGPWYLLPSAASHRGLCSSYCGTVLLSCHGYRSAGPRGSTVQAANFGSI